MTSLVTFASDEGSIVGATLLVIVAALSTQYGHLISLPPSTIVLGLSRRLSNVSAAAQEACLVAMLRVSANGDAVSQEAISKIEVLAMTAGRRIRRVCADFTLSYLEARLNCVIAAL